MYTTTGRRVLEPWAMLGVGATCLEATKPLNNHGETRKMRHPPSPGRPKSSQESTAALGEVPRAPQGVPGGPKSAPKSPWSPQERSKSARRAPKSDPRALQSNSYTRKRFAASILRFASGERARVRASRISAQPLVCINQETRSRSKPERARERSSERESERASERESQRAEARGNERARARESEGVGERVSEGAHSHLNGGLSKRDHSELRSYREPSPHSNCNTTLCIKCTGRL